MLISSALYLKVVCVVFFFYIFYKVSLEIILVIYPEYFVYYISSRPLILMSIIPITLWNPKYQMLSAYVVTIKWNQLAQKKWTRLFFRSCSTNKELNFYKVVKCCQSNWVNYFSCFHWIFITSDGWDTSE